MAIGIAAIRSFLPGEPVSNAECVAQHGFDEKFISEKLGISSRHVAAPDQYASDLAIAAARKLLAETDTDPASIGLLVVVTQTPDYCLPHVSALAQAALGLPTQVAAFDINLGCSGYVYGLSIAVSMMRANNLTKGLLITTETYSKLMAPEDRATAPLFGDGAAATLLSDDPLYTLGRFRFGTDGERAEALIARGSAVRRDRSEPLYMDGREIFNFVLSEMPPAIQDCLAANGVAADEIDAWVFHQASRHMMQNLATRAKVPPDKLVVEMKDIGNTTSSSIPIALERGVLPRAPRPRRVFISGFGVGLSWASTIIVSTN